jgi:L-cysteate sulfo-lyase
MPVHDTDTLVARLDEFPRERLAHLPTPLQFLPRLSEALGGPPIWIKRDDCTGLAMGGNKARKLEYLMGASRAEGCDGVVTFGAVQSNHARQTAAAAAALGLTCDLILVTDVDYREPAWEVSGNRLLDELLGAKIHIENNAAAAGQRLNLLLEAAQTNDRRLSVVPIGGSSATGALGYVGCAAELMMQITDWSTAPSSLVHATSSLGTQTGLLIGLQAMGSSISLRSVNVSAPEERPSSAELRTLCDATASLFGVEPPADDRLCIEGGFLGASYGVPTQAMQEAVESLARLEGILLDPVYTGKAMAWLFHAIRQGHLGNERPVIFLHTGGSPGLFAYQQFLAARPAH